MTESVVDRVRDFAARELVGREAYWDQLADRPPFDLYRRFHEAGLAHWWLPESEGGPGLSLEESADVVSELAYGDAGIAFTFLAPYSGTVMLSLFGSEDLYPRYAVPMYASGGFCALAASEHEAGSELVHTATVAERHGDEVVLNGVKAFSTAAGFADFLMVLVREAGEAGEFRMAVVPRDTPGLTMNKRWPVVGLRSSWTYEFTLDDCRIPADHLLAGNGVRVLEAGLNALRVLLGALALGVSRRIRDLCMEYAAGKRLGDGILMDNAVFEARLGQMEMEIDVMRNQCRTAGREFDALAARPDAAQQMLRVGTQLSAVVSKMYCGQAGWRIAAQASEMFGGLGYTEELPIAKLLRDIRHTSILDGGDDVLRQLIYRRYVVPPFRRR